MFLLSATCVYKDSANERDENLFSDCRVQPIFYKDTTKS